jgi:uncharacterized SAM-binding protein YcdF (DUF218 family)
MFFTLSKIAGYMLNPLGWIIVIMLVGVLTGNPKRKKKWYILGLFLLLIFTNPFLGDEAIRVWESPIISKSDTIKKYTAGVLLCGDIASYDKPSSKIIFKSGADRLLQTIQLYHNGVLKKIIISGGSGHLLYRDRTEAAFIKKYLVTIGIKPGDIIFESRSKNTYENARFTKELLVENNIVDEVLLITSALHMKRASATFMKQGILVNEYPTSKIVGERLKNFDHLLIPSITTLNNWNLLLHEWFGYASYKISGYC